MFFEEITIQDSSSIIATMRRMDEVKHKMLLAYHGEEFYSIVTIGDLQRAIIANHDLKTPIREILNQADKTYVSAADSIEDVKKEMQRIRCEFMPVLNDRNEVEHVYFWDEIFADEANHVIRDSINLPVVIMAGGKGTRLKPLTNVIPKPLVPIGEKTIMEEIMDQFESIGCHKFYMSVNYKSDLMRYYLGQLKHHYDVEFFEEPKPLGTIGSVALLKGRITTPFFVSNCDILIDQDYRDVYNYHVSNRNDLTIVTAVKSFQIPYGVIETGEDGLMTGLTEKPEHTYMINTGVYLLQPGLIDEIPEGQFFHITHLMEKVVKRGGRIGCFPVSEHAWRDMGDWNEYLKIIG